jgi:cytochrome P450
MLMESAVALEPAPAGGPPAHDPSLPSFDREAMRSGLIESIFSRIFSSRWLYSILRRSLPIWKVPTLNGAVLVTRCDDVREILEQDRIFEVPYAGKIRRLNGGPNFILGMQDGEEYRKHSRQVMQAFTLEDVEKIVAPTALQSARALVDASPGLLDAIEDLIMRVPVVLCERYYGVQIPDGMKTEFAYWTIAMSSYLFGDWRGKGHGAALAEAGAARMRRLVDASIRNAQVQPSQAGDTVLARLLRLRESGALELDDDGIRAYLIGMVMGFVPTNALAGGNALEMLLCRPDFMRQTRAAALAGNDELLRRCLLETMRFRPIGFVPQRVCARAYTLAAGTSRATTLPEGTRVLASTRSAMFDACHIRNPGSFDPGRDRSAYMYFGHGLHWCVGTFIAQAQLTQTFKVLLMQHNLRAAAGRKGKLERLGDFPRHLYVEFDR